MTLPDDAGTDTGRPRMGRTTIVAVIAVVAGLITLGNLTSPDPETVAAATSTTSTTSTTVEPLQPPIDLDNFSIGQIATGEPLPWSHTGSFRNIYPEILTEYDGSFYLFGPASPTFAQREEGLRAWRSDDGVEWEQLGVVIGRDALIRGVRATSLGLVALEVADAELRLWHSPDGVEWEHHEATIELESEYTNGDLLAAASIDRAFLIAAYTYFDSRQLIEERLRDIGVDIDRTTMGWTPVPSVAGGLSVEVYGPFGLRAALLTADDLGLSEEEQRWFSTGFGGPTGTHVWRVEADWELAEGTEDIAWIDGFVNSPDGDVIAYGHGNVPALWRSADGLTWERNTPGISVDFMTSRGEGLVAVRPAAIPQVALSADGETWEDTDLDSHFPQELQWSIGSLGTGDGGIAVLVEGWETPRLVDQRPDPVVLSTENESGILTLHFEDETRFEFDNGENTYVARVIHGGPVPEGMAVDLANQTVSFTDVESGEVLGTFSFDALNQAEASYSSGLASAADESYRAIAFSPDGETWTIQDLGTSVGEGAWIFQLVVSQDHVVALIGRSPLFPSGSGHLFEVWAAEIP